MKKDWKDFPIVMLPSGRINYDDKALYYLSGKVMPQLVYGHINDDFHNTEDASRRFLYILDPNTPPIKGDYYYIHESKTAEYGICYCDSDRLAEICSSEKDKVSKIIASDDDSLIDVPWISGGDIGLYIHKHMKSLMNSKAGVDTISLYVNDGELVIKGTGQVSVKGFYSKDSDLEDKIYQAIGLAADPESGIINQAFATKNVMEVLYK